jgi:UDP-N-acetylmuramyl pentapeptide synthase
MGAREAGLEAEKIRAFSTSLEAGRYLDAEIRQGDIVLIKGSQSMRMEKTVKDLMAEPARAGELLVRQYGKWLVT